VIVKPETVIHWHRKRFRLFWTGKVRRGQSGRPPLSQETRNLIRQMSRGNPLWGAPRIHGELLKLGIDIGETTRARWPRTTLEYKRECPIKGNVKRHFSPPAGRRGYTFGHPAPCAVSSTEVDRRGAPTPAAGHRVAIRSGFMLVIVTTPFLSQN
jgi:hypothetical protein